MKLPVLISIPHGGFKIPEEVAPLVKLSKAEIFDDIDPFAREIFNLDDSVMALVESQVARCFVDVNRTPSDRPPQHPDGAVKLQTRSGLPIYDPPLSTELADQLISRYHQPFHEQLNRAKAIQGLQLALDCHTMHAVGPVQAPDPGQRRPMICLSNLDGTTSTMERLSWLGDCMARAFKVPRSTVALNKPFRGGYIIRSGYSESRPDLPWIQVELNRSLYMEQSGYGEEGPATSQVRLRELNWSFNRALTLYFRGNQPRSGPEPEPILL